MPARPQLQAPPEPAPSTALGNLKAILIVVVFGGGAMLWMGLREKKLAALAQAEPQVLTCRALQEHGPGANAHVRMTHFLLLVDSFAVEKKWNETSWTRAWIPAVPVEGEFAKAWMEAPEGKRLRPPKDLRVLVELGKGDETLLQGVARADVLQGTVMNEIDALDGDVARILAASYPGVDPSRCWILQQGRVPKSGAAAWALVAVGVAMIVGSLAGGAYAHVYAKKRVEVEARTEERRV